MINREDMMELTRRMTLSRTSFTRLAGCYTDAQGEFDGSFNTNFLKLSAPERARNLEIAKAIPFANTNDELRKYSFFGDSAQTANMRRLLTAMKECGLKNDALMDTFYDIMMEQYQSTGEYAVFVFHDRYDVPVKAADKERLWESEEVFEYLICAVCPLIGEYEPDMPECGFLYPVFTDRSSDPDHIAVFDRNHRHPELLKILGVCDIQS